MFWINKILRDKGSKFSSRLEPGIKNLVKITGPAMKKYTSLRPCRSYERNFSNCVQKPEFFRLLHAIAKIAFITASVIASVDQFNY